MGNCLKTQLKEVVNNDSLNVLGALEFFIGINSYLGITALEPRKNILTLKDNISPYPEIIGDVITHTSSYVANSMSSIRLYTRVDETKPGTFTVTDKYSIRRLENCFPRTLKDIVFMPNLEVVVINSISAQIPNTNFNVNDLSIISDKSKLSNFTIEGSSSNYDIFGEIATFNTFTNLEYLYLKYSQCTGSVEDITALVKIKTLNVAYSGYISGSINPLLDAMAPTKNNGDKVFVIGNGTITYKVGNVDTVIDNAQEKEITFDGQGGYTIA